MWTKIVAKLKTLSVPNVVPFGVRTLPQPPYTVVKPEKEGIGRGRLFRVIGHRLPSEQGYLEDYILEEVKNALDGFTITTRVGNYNRISYVEYSDIITNNDDGTIAMEITFLMPAVLFEFN